jgi:hypothetical protein
MIIIRVYTGYKHETYNLEKLDRQGEDRELLKMMLNQCCPG